MPKRREDLSNAKAKNGCTVNRSSGRELVKWQILAKADTRKPGRPKKDRQNAPKPDCPSYRYRSDLMREIRCLKEPPESASVVGGEM